jgi:hypothetical protein
LILTQPYAPGSANFSVSACGWIDQRENYNNFVIGVYDASGIITPGNSIQVNFIYGSGRKVTYQKFVSGTGTYDIAVNSVPAAGVLTGEGIILHLQRVSGTWGIYYSYNGIEWQALNASHSQSITVAGINTGFGCGGGTTNKVSGAIHWVRRDWLFL